MVYKRNRSAYAVKNAKSSFIQLYFTEHRSILVYTHYSVPKLTISSIVFIGLIIVEQHLPRPSVNHLPTKFLQTI